MKAGNIYYPVQVPIVKKLPSLKILVTGGVGFIGTNLIKRLLAEGHEVISVDNYSTGKKKNEQKGCVYLKGDVN